MSDRVNPAVRIVAAVEEMAPDKIRTRLGRSLYNRVIRRDPRPMFVELVAAHEGYSTGDLVVGRSRKKARKLWSRERVAELAKRLRFGVPLFLGHGGADRKPVGRVLTAFERWLSGRAAAVGVGYIEDPAVRAMIREGRLDTCSVEADIECARETKDAESWVVSAVRKVTGVALGDSRIDRPGFQGAAVLAVVEEFEGEDAPEDDPREQAASPGPSIEDRLRRIEEQIALERAEIERLGRVVRESDIKAPPERERHPFHNPLIPRPRGF